MDLTEKKLIEKIDEIETKKGNLEKKIKKLEQELKKFKSNKKNEKRRKRAHHLIKVGALLEIAEIDKEDKNTLLGYFLRYSKLSKNDKINLKVNGLIKLETRKRERERMKEDGKKRVIKRN